MDSSNDICWISPFVILVVLGLFCRFYSFFLTENSVIKATKMKIVEFANSADREEAAPNKLSHFDLQYLPFTL